MNTVKVTANGIDISSSCIFDVKTRIVHLPENLPEGCDIRINGRYMDIQPVAKYHKQKLRLNKLSYAIGLVIERMQGARHG